MFCCDDVTGGSTILDIGFGRSLFSTALHVGSHPEFLVMHRALAYVAVLDLFVISEYSFGAEIFARSTRASELSRRIISAPVDPRTFRRRGGGRCDCIALGHLDASDARLKRRTVESLFFEEASQAMVRLVDLLALVSRWVTSEKSQGHWQVQPWKRGTRLSYTDFH